MFLTHGLLYSISGFRMCSDCGFPLSFAPSNTFNSPWNHPCFKLFLNKLNKCLGVKNLNSFVRVCLCPRLMAMYTCPQSGMRLIMNTCRVVVVWIKGLWWFSPQWDYQRFEDWGYFIQDFPQEEKPPPPSQKHSSIKLEPRMTLNSHGRSPTGLLLSNHVGDHSPDITPLIERVNPISRSYANHINMDKSCNQSLVTVYVI